MSRPSFGELGGEDPYDILGLGPDAGDDDVRAARRRLLRRYHPDLPAGDLRRTQMITAAADLLLDPTRRLAYFDRRAQQARETVVTVAEPSVAPGWRGAAGGVRVDDGRFTTPGAGPAPGRTPPDPESTRNGPRGGRRRAQGRRGSKGRHWVSRPAHHPTAATPDDPGTAGAAGSTWTFTGPPSAPTGSASAPPGATSPHAGAASAASGPASEPAGSGPAGPGFAPGGPGSAPGGPGSAPGGPGSAPAGSAPAAAGATAARAGAAFNGAAFNGSAYNGSAYNGSAFDGSAFDGSAFDGPASDRAGAHDDYPGADRRRSWSTLAIAAVMMAFTWTPIGLPLGLLALRQIRRTGQRGATLAVLGTLLGAGVLAAYLSVFVASTF